MLATACLHNDFTEGGTSPPRRGRVVRGGRPRPFPLVGPGRRGEPGVTSDHPTRPPPSAPTRSTSWAQPDRSDPVDLRQPGRHQLHPPVDGRADSTRPAEPLRHGGHDRRPAAHRQPQLPPVLAALRHRQRDRRDRGDREALELPDRPQHLLGDSTSKQGRPDHLPGGPDVQPTTPPRSGCSEAGAMARLRSAWMASIGIAGTTAFPRRVARPAGRPPSRRLNFFDYAADGQLNGAISIDQLRILAHNLLPAPDAFVTVDRQRSSEDGYLLSPTANRDYANLQHPGPSYVFVQAKSTVARFRNTFRPSSTSAVATGSYVSVRPVFFTLRGEHRARSCQQGQHGEGRHRRQDDERPRRRPPRRPSRGRSPPTTTSTATATPPTTSSSDLINTIKSIAGVSKTATAASQAPKLGTPTPAGSIVAQTTGSTSLNEAATFAPASAGIGAPSRRRRPTSRRRSRIIHRPSSYRRPAHRPDAAGLRSFRALLFWVCFLSGPPLRTIREGGTSE